MNATPAPGQSTVDAAAAAAMLDDGLTCLRQGNLDGAEQRCRALLEAEPDHVRALVLLGVVLGSRRRSGDAVEVLKRATRLAPDNPDAFVNLGVVLRDSGRPAEALAAYQHALALAPGHAEAHNNCGNLLLGMDRAEDALRHFEAALAIRPDYVEAGNNCGSALLALKRYEHALSCFRRVIARQGDHAAAHNNAGIALTALDCPGEALTHFERAIALKPDYGEAERNRGVTLAGLQRLDEALRAFERAAQLLPNDAKTHAFLAGTLTRCDRHAEAVRAYERASELEPDDPNHHYNRGVALTMVGRLADVIAAYDRAIALKPDYAEALNNRGLARADIGDDHGALDDYARAIALKPGYALANFNRSLSLLRQGDFAQGLLDYEWRWLTLPAHESERFIRHLQWTQARPVNGRTVLLHCEQGLGDTLQFCRYVPLLAARGARVVLETYPHLLRLMTSLEGIAELVVRGRTLPPFDYHCPLVSLPLAFDTRLETIPADVPYLHADAALAAAWGERLADAAGPRVGIVWSGSTTHRRDRHRSLPLAALEPLFDAAPCAWVCLQKELRDSDRAVLAGRTDLRWYGDALRDFADTAALITQLDLVVTVDTSVAHLAGALGVPVWVLLPYSPDFRWLYGRDDSPWYPSMRLFRQARLDEWSGVIERAGAALAERYAPVP